MTSPKTEEELERLAEQDATDIYGHPTDEWNVSSKKHYKSGFIEGMLAHQAETELLRKRIEKLRATLKSQLKWKPNYKNDDGSDPDICDAESWDDVSSHELRDILADVFTDARKVLRADDKASEGGVE
jgi:hypothetical protein